MNCDTAPPIFDAKWAMIQLSAQDATFIHLERPDAPWNGGVVMVYDRATAPGAVTFEDVLEHVRQRLHLVDALRMKVVRVPGNLDRPYWVEDRLEFRCFDLRSRLRIGLAASFRMLHQRERLPCLETGKIKLAIMSRNPVNGFFSQRHKLPPALGFSGGGS